MDSKKMLIGAAVVVIAVSAGVGGYMLYKKRKTDPTPIKTPTYTIARDIILDEDENPNPYYLRSAPRPYASSGRCASMNTPTAFRY